MSRAQNNYIAGFISCLIISTLAYLATILNWLHGWSLIAVIAALALVQAMIQLACFLHLFQGDKPRYRLGVFAVALTILLIVVGGSVWIMNNINYRMNYTQMRQYMESQPGL